MAEHDEAILGKAILAVVDIESQSPEPSVEEYARAVLDAVAPVIEARALRGAADAFGHMWQADDVSAPQVYAALRDRADRIEGA
jgi:hypothetical protein